MSWKIDPVHSEINFTVRHMMISNVRGGFEKFNGTVDFNEANPAASSVEVQIDAASINTRDAQRDGHLKSPDFFDVQNYPWITFKSKRVNVVDVNHGRITGDLTIHGVTKEVVLDAEYAGMMKSPFGTLNAGFSATTKINRKDWGLMWNMAMETGGVMVGEEIKINIELEIIKIEEAQAAST
jgi:polyisoprenoid-binding protein YceI